ncbi:MAG TPA: ribosome biogenesis GTPase Der, partial [Gammaproteobacteria bacterium]|nr:ribosome biogenesis GTPase Der [Gammaproteobacteria bacterium]
MGLPVISLVGRPNVGKSTLFNRLSKSRQALVSDFEGLTRDRQYTEVLLDDDSETFVTIIDTGGLTNEVNEIDSGIQGQVLNALEESDIIYFIVSARDGVIGLDREIGAQLRRLKKKIVLVCNKAEGLDLSLAAEFYELGLGEPILIAAEHGQGIEELIDHTLPLLPQVTDD